MAGRSALVTVMFTDIVNSTDIAGEMGDRRWRELIARHHRIVRSELRRFGGREIDTAGDGFFASFDRPAEAVRCACSIVQAVRELGIEVRAGVHVGEAEVMGRGLSGMAVHTGARIAALGGPGEVLVSGTLRDLVPGAPFGFDDRGVRQLKGVREAPRVLAVVEVDETPVAPPVDGHEAAARRRAIVPPPAYRRQPVWIAGLVALLAAVGVVAFVVAGSDDPAPPDAPAHNVAVLVDPNRSRVGPGIPLPANYEVTFEAPQVAVGEGGVWIMNGECVCRIDPETLEVERPEVSLPAQMALGHRAVWVATFNAVIVPVNAAAVEASAPIELPEGQVFHASITTTEEAVWTAFRNEIARIDPTHETISDPIPLEHGADDVLGVGPDMWIVDRLAKTLYLHGPDGEQLDSVELHFTPDDVVAGPDGSLWVLNRSGGTVTRVDTEGELGQPIRVGADATDVAVGPDGVWVADHEAHTIQRIDPELEQQDDPIRLPGPVEAIGVDDSSGEVWAYLD
jgi:class 3 adenylate cyclase/streptogramin lyase